MEYCRLKLQEAGMVLAIKAVLAHKCPSLKTSIVVSGINLWILPTTLLTEEIVVKAQARALVGIILGRQYLPADLWSEEIKKVQNVQKTVITDYKLEMPFKKA